MSLLVLYFLVWNDRVFLPCVICSHSATLFNNRLVVFGGWDSPVCYNDLFILDLGEFGKLSDFKNTLKRNFSV